MNDHENNIEKLTNQCIKVVWCVALIIYTILALVSVELIIKKQRGDKKMREIIVKYNGECKRCNAVLDVGTKAMYEKSMGCFCVGCEPKDVEEIRFFRLAKNEKKADKYDEWAHKRRN